MLERRMSSYSAGPLDVGNDALLNAGNVALPFYHQFITQTVSAISGGARQQFWRDDVAKMSWSTDYVYHAMISLAAMHKTSTDASRGRPSPTALRTFALQNYQQAIKLLSKDSNASALKPVQVLATLTLFSYFECFIGGSVGLFRNLWAAIQVFEAHIRNQSHLDGHQIQSLLRSIVSLDFQAQVLVPYAQTSIQGSTRERLIESASPCNIKNEEERVVQLPSEVSGTVCSERDELLRLISSFNKSDRIIWGPWYGSAGVSDSSRILGFQKDLRAWKARSTQTFSSFVKSDDTPSPPPCPSSELSDKTRPPDDQFPLPPTPLPFTSSEAAMNVATYNTYMACTSSLLYHAGVDSVRYKSAMYYYVYANLRIAEFLYPPPDRENSHLRKLVAHALLPLLYWGGRRAIPETWRKWTIAKLKQIGPQGLYPGHTFANVLEIMSLVKVHFLAGFPNGVGHFDMVPLLVTVGADTPNLEAVYLHEYAPEDFRIVARATWVQDGKGNRMKEDINYECDAYKDVNTRVPWRQKVEGGWHSLLYLNESPSPALPA
ncbi:MAG: hypothetical protein ASARMPRED_000216 [Alectoria sarmentosa]|nr:MAG: hypothetical protein ASARMPRED_000216 [Alectoria sarmentosa]